jgi:transcriptional regulator with XRE-family HTH domain
MRDTSANVFRMAGHTLQGRVTLGIDSDRWDRIVREAGLPTEAQQARKIGVSRQHLNRVRNGHAAPGPDFIAGVRLAFPGVSTDELFPIITRKTA